MSDIKEVISNVLSSCKSKGDLAKIGMLDEKGNVKPISSYKLTYDSQQNQLEPIYYWILDFIQGNGWETKKVVDNFMSSPGSGHFAEMGQRATKMQEEGMKILGGLNQTIKSALNLIYDLKEFRMRLSHYEDYMSDDPKKKEEGDLALKQIWLDNVDMKRGRGSIHQMAAELGYTTIREAFMVAKDVEDLKKMNKGADFEKDPTAEGGLINDQVYRILVPRMNEFLKWIDYSYKELKKRFKIEQSYLRSQVETIKLYSQWMKPYLKAAEELRQKGFDGNAALVNAFSTSMFELTLLGRKKASIPKKFDKYPMRRDYFSVIIITFKFRGHVSQRVTQRGDYGFAGGGRVDMTFDSYALNEEELHVVNNEMKNEDVAESMTFRGDVAAEALETLKDDLKEFLTDPKEEEEEKKKAAKRKKNENDVNPLLVLGKGVSDILSSIFGGVKKKDNEEKKKLESADEIKKDNYIERAVRAGAASVAVDGLYLVYDVYKKVHGFSSSPTSFDNGNPGSWKKKAEGEEVSWKDVWKSDFSKVK